MWGIIINPKSGKKALRQQRKYLFKILKANQILFDYKVTQYAGHAVELARDFVERKVENILVMGGDGTMSEVINGIFSAKIEDTSKLKIALIPRGTGNDWGRYWGLTRNYKKAIDVFLKGKTQSIDIGQIDYTRNGDAHKHFFINSVGFGLDHKVVQQTHILKYYFGSHGILYLVSLLAAVFTYKPQKMHIVAENANFRGKLFTMNIGNGCYTGGGIKQNPEADPTDGIFHAMFLEKPKFMDIVAALGCIFNGKLTQLPIIKTIKGNKIQLITNKFLPFETDGIEVTACGPYTISLLPSAIQMIVPR